jgi:type I restriction enzyme S subunit
LNRVESGDFIYSRLFAWRGAFGVIGDDLAGCFVSGEFPIFRSKDDSVDLRFLFHWFRLPRTLQVVADLCTGSTPLTRNRFKEEFFLGLEIPLPPLDEQRRIVSRIEEVATRVEAVRRLSNEQEDLVHKALQARFSWLIEGAPRRRMSEIAPQVRRSVDLDPERKYPELGIRSFGKGTFHKPSLSGLELGDKRVFRIEPGDLIFSNVFAWEGAIAVVQPEDAGRVGSHRYITCVVNPNFALAEFLCFYFLTPEGLEKIRAGSPGGAGRNRTLGLTALDAMEVPVPSLESQKSFRELLCLYKVVLDFRAQGANELDSMVPSILDRAFRGEL